MYRGLLLGVGLLLLGMVAAAVPSDAYTVVDTPLTSSPFSDATSMAALPTHTSVSILARQGGWYQVSLATGQTGWVRMTSLGFNTGTTPKTRNATIAGILGLFSSGRSGAGAGTDTTGVRGLNTGDIAAAKPDTAAVDALKAWIATPDDARQYSAALPLRPNVVVYVGADGKPGKP